ncbi:transmembrane protein, putative [Medicago truncatula]|uniref:Transmembrane protein, putative n=1 Tax=Medicago truncatula TaxID=3880 RepID=G7LD06_MEDTR|nr:transmembrane protein, putative [Medicago truncatula]
MGIMRVVFAMVLVVVVIVVSPCLVNGRNYFHEKTMDVDGINSTDTDEVLRGDNSSVEDSSGSKIGYSSENVLVGKEAQ